MRIDRRRLSLGAAAAFSATAVLAPAGARADDEPMLTIRRILDAYQADRVPRPLYTPAVRLRLRRANLGADFIVDGQDFEVKGVSVREVSRTGDKAEVEARFTNFGVAREVRFDLWLVEGDWMIANVRDQKGFDLRKTLRMPALE